MNWKDKYDTNIKVGDVIEETGVEDPTYKYGLVYKIKIDENGDTEGDEIFAHWGSSPKNVINHIFTMESTQLPRECIKKVLI